MRTYVCLGRTELELHVEIEGAGRAAHRSHQRRLDDDNDSETIAMTMTPILQSDAAGSVC